LAKTKFVATVCRFANYLAYSYCDAAWHHGVCPETHHPSRVVPIDPETEQRRPEHEEQQERRKRLMTRRAETFDRILEHVPSSFPAPQLRVLLRAFVTIDACGYTDDVATHYVGDDENLQQRAEEILLSIADRLEDDQLPHFALRLALTTHTGIPDENAIDHLAEAERIFAFRQSEKTVSKKATRKPKPAKGKPVKKKSANRLDA
jgi:nucleotide-binding universal stress UspA family protein